MGLSICLIFLTVVSLLSLTAMENNLLNQKMSASYQAKIIAFNTAEAGLIAMQAQINGEFVNLNNLQGKLSYNIISDYLDECQQHIYNILATASYQNAQVKLQSIYLKAHDPPISNCSLNQASHSLEWQEVN